MQFAAAHKAATFLMVASAFAAIAFSGELGDATTLAAVAAGGIAWFWEPPRVRPERFVPVWTALALAAFGWTVLALLTGESALLAGARFLVFLLIVKLFNRLTSRDHLQICLLAFLMLVAGTTLNPQLSFAICFLGYVVFATWAFVLLHLRREMEDNLLVRHRGDAEPERLQVDRILASRRVVDRRFLAGTGAVSLATFALAGLLFLVFPRIGFGLFFQQSRPGIAMAGFSDGVTLGGHGLIRDDATVVMRVVLSDPLRRGGGAADLHFRGVAFDRYAGGQWSRSRAAPVTELTREPLADGGVRALLEPLPARSLRQEIYLEPIDTTALFAAARPLAFDLDAQQFTRPGRSRLNGQNDEVRMAHGAGIRYIAHSDPDLPSDARLAAAPNVADPAAMAVYLELPVELPARVIELATTITAGKTTTLERVRAVHSYLQRGYRYTLQMKSNPGQEPLDHFLFDRKAGHCEYFSSAMAILLRAAGVPTRNVNGFLGGEWNEFGSYLAVRSGDAHSWVEVWFEGIGWVTWDPTPAGGTTSRLATSGFVDKLRRALDTLRLQWFRWVVEYDLSRQISIFGRVRDVFQSGRSSGAGVLSQLRAGLVRHRDLVAAGILVLAIIAGLIVWRRTRGASRSRSSRSAGPDHPVVALWAKQAARYGRLGHPRRPGDTPREQAAAARRADAPGAVEFVELCELYYTARYAPPEAARAVDLPRARELVRAISAAFAARRASKSAAQHAA